MIKDFYKSLNVKVGVPLQKHQRIDFNHAVFDFFFIPRMRYCEDYGFVVELDKKDKEIIENFALAKAKAKEKEWKGFDNQKRIKRETTGASVEYALLKFYERERYFDDSIVEKSFRKNHPDLLPLGVICDIKGSSINNVPLVFRTVRSYVCESGKHRGKKYRCANVIGITDNNLVWLLGVASPSILESYVDDNLIMIAENTTKTGFYGVDKLVDLPKSWKKFQFLCSKLSSTF
jgi:hypothetical protein